MLSVRSSFNGPPGDPFGKAGIFLAACCGREDRLRWTNGSRELASTSLCPSRRIEADLFLSQSSFKSCFPPLSKGCFWSKSSRSSSGKHECQHKMTIHPIVVWKGLQAIDLVLVVSSLLHQLGAKNQDESLFDYRELTDKSEICTEPVPPFKRAPEFWLWFFRLYFFHTTRKQVVCGRFLVEYLTSDNALSVMASKKVHLSCTIAKYIIYPLQQRLVTESRPAPVLLL